MAKYLILILLLFTKPTFAEDPCSILNDDYVPIKDRYEKGLLFELKKCGEPTSYLFGTMHSDDPELLPLLAPVKDAMLKTNSANFELKQDPQQMMEVLKVMYYPATGTKTLKSAIGLEMYRELQELLAKERPDMPEIVFQRMKPWAVAMLMQYPPEQADGVYVDLRLENYAEENNIEVFGLETAAEQMSFFNDLSTKDSIEFLNETIDGYYESETMTNELSNAYKERDLNKMSKMADEAFAKMKNADFQKKFMDKLIKERNKTMIKRALPRMQKGAFIGVGALHLPWEDGLLKLFEKEGYRVYVAD